MSVCLFSVTQPPEIITHHAHIIPRPYLLELLAGAALVAGQMMDGADGRPCIGSVRACLKEEMGAFFPGRLEDHACTIKGIDAAIFPDSIGVDHEDVKVLAASSAAKTDHVN